MYEAQGVALNTENLPRCSRCDMPVEHLYVDWVESKRIVMLIIMCHGETEVVDVPYNDWANAIPETFNFGPAFDGPPTDTGDCKNESHT